MNQVRKYIYLDNGCNLGCIPSTRDMNKLYTATLSHLTRLVPKMTNNSRHQCITYVICVFCGALFIETSFPRKDAHLCDLENPFTRNTHAATSVLMSLKWYIFCTENTSKSPAHKDKTMKTPL